MPIKEEILADITELFLRYGIRSVTTDDISNELHISKKTLYKHFENKADIVKQVVRKYIDNEESDFVKVNKTATNAIEEIALINEYGCKKFTVLPPTLLYDLKKYYPESWKIVDAFTKNFILSAVKENITTGIKEKFYRQDINPEIIAKLYSVKMDAVLSDSSFLKKNFSKEELYKQLFLYHFLGITTEKGIIEMRKFYPDI